MVNDGGKGRHTILYKTQCEKGEKVRVHIVHNGCFNFVDAGKQVSKVKVDTTRSKHKVERCAMRKSDISQVICSPDAFPFSFPL